MEKLKNNKFLYNFINETLLALVIFPLIDMFFRVVVDKKEFVYSVNDHIFGPIMFGFFFALFTMILDKVSSKKNKS